MHSWYFKTSELASIVMKARSWGRIPVIATSALLFTSVTNAQGDGNSGFDVLDYIDPFIGTENGGR